MFDGVPRDVLRQRGVNVRTIPAIDDLELLEVVQDGHWGRTAPAIADGLEIIVGGGDVAVRFLGFDIKSHVAEIGPEGKKA